MTRPESHCVHAPVEAAHLLQRDPQASQFPLSVRKNPSAHVLHWVLFALVAVVQPGEQVQVEPEQTPFAQLQVEGAPSGMAGVRQTPVPVIPSLHLEHPVGQGLH